ncbi:hypothetical protein F2P81_018767 [Scophthalmus maximus]|uniref:Uncharacterized protein n=1 Tax=Scophthalmus maximus TaxID=52904 RepID=A0A6A4SH07_SCOMX|nr:hypothetical protein F2P81_018767 [Scophthalmus maximus]
MCGNVPAAVNASDPDSLLLRTSCRRSLTPYKWIALTPLLLKAKRKYESRGRPGLFYTRRLQPLRSLLGCNR